MDILYTESSDIRWKQRFSNLVRSFVNLEAAVSLSSPDLFQRAALVQFFSMTFELSWKTLKDLLEFQGFVGVDTPRSVLKKAFEVGLISHGDAWLDCLEKRNLMAHVYDESIAAAVDSAIRSVYFPLIGELVGVLEEESRK